MSIHAHTIGCKARVGREPRMGASEAVGRWWGSGQPIGLEAGPRLDWAVTVGPWSLA